MESPWLGTESACSLVNTRVGTDDRLGSQTASGTGSRGATARIDFLGVSRPGQALVERGLLLRGYCGTEGDANEY